MDISWRPELSRSANGSKLTNPSIAFVHGETRVCEGRDASSHTNDAFMSIIQKLGLVQKFMNAPVENVGNNISKRAFSSKAVSKYRYCGQEKGSNGAANRRARKPTTEEQDHVDEREMQCVPGESQDMGSVLFETAQPNEAFFLDHGLQHKGFDEPVP